MKIEKNVITDGVRCLVQKNGQYYVVDLSYTFDHGPEAMAFPADENGTVISWTEEFVQWYGTVSEENLLSAVEEFLAE